jgi:hypothetical protein
MNKHYQFRYAENGHTGHYNMTFQYVVGQNDTVTLKFTILPDFTRECEVTVNGQMCHNCYEANCEDQFSGIFVDCENVEDAGAVDLCQPKPEDVEGPLAVFAFPDLAFLQGCPPRFPS